MKKPVEKLLDSVFLMRPLLLLPVWSPFLLGYYRSEARSKYSFIAFLGVTCLGGTIYILNQIYDIETDRLNQKLFILPRGLLSTRWAWSEYIILTILTLLFFLRVGVVSAILAFLGIIMGILYSHPRYSLKDRGWWALMLNGVGHGGLIYLLGWTTGKMINGQAILHSLPYIIAFSAVYLLTTIPDIFGDKMSNKNTLAVQLGEKKSKLIAIGLIVVASFLSIFFLEQSIYMSGLFSFPFLILSFKKPDYLQLAIKVAVFVMAIVTSVFFPLFFFLVVLVIIGSRLYYRKRFGLNYPF